MTPLETLELDGYGPEDFHRTDAGNAKLFALQHAGKVLYDWRRNRWLIWSGHHWAEDPNGAIHRLARDTAEFRYLWARKVEDLKARAQMSRWAIGSEQRNRLDATLALARSEDSLADRGDRWDADPYLLGCPNGVVRLDSGKVWPGAPHDRITLQVATDFDPSQTCRRWERFLREVFQNDEELIAFVHRAIGYSLTADTREQCLFICCGKGANGKTTLTRVLRHILGTYAADTPFTTLELRSRASIPNDVAALAGKRLVTASECSEASRLNEARVKALTGGDDVTARFMHCEWFTFRPVAKFWLSVNHKPRVRDDSEGFWRRVRLVPFLRQFKGEDDDRDLEAKLLAEAPGILAWAVRGCLSWKKVGLRAPETVTKATSDYRAESDPLAEFLEESCVPAPGASVRASEFYSEYRQWAERQKMRDREQLSRTAFGTRMAERFERKKRNTGWLYHGIGLKVTG